MDHTRIQHEYEKAVLRKKELMEKLRELERTHPEDLYNIWITRDQIAYWEGKSEGLKIAMDVISPGE